MPSVSAKSSTDQLLFDETFAIEADKYLQAVRKQKAQNTSLPETKPHFPSRPHTPIPPQSLPEKTPTPQPKQPPMVIPKAHSHSTTHSKDFHYKRPGKYHLTPRPPMDKRDMAGVWRKLRRPQREGFSQDLDIQATTNALSQTGFLTKPVMQYRSRNQAKLVVMIDQGGSMEPFTLFIDALLDSLSHSGALKQIDIFYFHDTPEGFLYRKPTLLGARSLDSILTEYAQNASILIVGDAGAARGHYDSIRLRTTQEFIETVRQYTYLFGWLNPVPKARWTSATAWHIAQLLPMFQLDWEGLNDIVNVLRGQALTGAQPS